MTPSLTKTHRRVASENRPAKKFAKKTGPLFFSQNLPKNPRKVPAQPPPPPLPRARSGAAAVGARKRVGGL